VSVEYCTGAQSGAGLSRFARLARGGSLRYGRVAAGAPDRTGDCPRLEAAIRTRENPRQPCDSVAHRPFGLLPSLGPMTSVHGTLLRMGTHTSAMSKNIAISDDVYRELSREKGDRSFSEVIQDHLEARRQLADVTGPASSMSRPRRR